MEYRIMWLRGKVSVRHILGVIDMEIVVSHETG